MDIEIPRLAEENPWWRSKSAPPESGLARRRPYGRFARLSLGPGGGQPVILQGMRKVGKTVMLKQVIGEAVSGGAYSPGNVCYANMEAALLSGVRPSTLARKFRAGSRAGKPCLVVLDEIQNCEDWQGDLARIAGGRKGTRVVAACSIAPALKRQGTGGRKGRLLRLRLSPLSFHEFCLVREDWNGRLPGTADEARTERLGRDDVARLNELFVDYINFGCYPGPAFDDGFSRDGDFGLNILDDDLFAKHAADYGISAGHRMLPVLRHIARNEAQEIALDKLAKNTGITRPTVNKYLEFLKAAFLVRQVTNFDAERGEPADRSPYKYVLESPAMHRAFSGRASLKGSEAGHRVEATVISQHRAPLLEGMAGDAMQVNYCRLVDSGREREVDLVHSNPAREVTRLAEVKWSDNTGSLDRAKGNLEFFHRRLRKARRFEGVFCTTRSVYHEAKDSNVRFLPTSQYCLSLGLDSLEGAPGTASG